MSSGHSDSLDNKARWPFRVRLDILSRWTFCLAGHVTHWTFFLVGHSVSFDAPSRWTFHLNCTFFLLGHSVSSDILYRLDRLVEHSVSLDIPSRLDITSRCTLRLTGHVTRCRFRLVGHSHLYIQALNRKKAMCQLQ